MRGCSDAPKEGIQEKKGHIQKLEKSLPGLANRDASVSAARLQLSKRNIFVR